MPVSGGAEIVLNQFMDAVGAGDVAAMSRYPELVNTRFEDATPLHIAALNGHMEAVRWLLDNGAELEACDREFHVTPLVWANERGHHGIVRYLLGRGAALTEWSAVSIGNLEQLKRLAAEDAEILEEERDFGTLLHQACIWGQAEIVEWLIEQGADPRRHSRDGYTPLELAERQARDGRSHAPLVTEERRAEIERNCAAIAARIRNLAGKMPSQGELAS